MKQRTTLFLLLLDLALSMLAAVMFLQFDDARSNAQRDQIDAAIVLTDLDDIAMVYQPAQGGGASPQITTGLQAAATTVGIAEQLQSVEVSPSRGDDEPPTLSIRLGAVTLEQLHKFLSNLQQSAQPLLSTNIHLSVPQGPDAVAPSAGETWTAEVALRAAIGGVRR